MNIEELKKELFLLNNEQQMIFALIMFNRAYPEYIKFSLNSNWGDANKLSNLVYIDNISSNEVKIANLLQVSPDGDTFGDVQACMARDVCAIVYDIICFTATKEITHIIEIQKNSLNIVYLYILSHNDLKIYANLNEIMQEKAMLDEIEQQYIIIQDIKTEQVKEKYKSIILS